MNEACWPMVALARNISNKNGHNATRCGHLLTSYLNSYTSLYLETWLLIGFDQVFWERLLVLIFRTAYSGQKLIKPVAMKITATIPQTIKSVPPITLKNPSAAMIRATAILMMPSVLLIFLIIVKYSCWTDEVKSRLYPSQCLWWRSHNRVIFRLICYYFSISMAPRLRDVRSSTSSFLSIREMVSRVVPNCLTTVYWRWLPALRNCSQFHGIRNSSSHGVNRTIQY